MENYSFLNCGYDISSILTIGAADLLGSGYSLLPKNGAFIFVAWLSFASCVRTVSFCRGLQPRQPKCQFSLPYVSAVIPYWPLFKCTRAQRERQGKLGESLPVGVVSVNCCFSRNLKKSKAEQH